MFILSASCINVSLRNDIVDVIIDSYDAVGRRLVVSLYALWNPVARYQVQTRSLAILQQPGPQSTHGISEKLIPATQLADMIDVTIRGNTVMRTLSTATNYSD